MIAFVPSGRTMYSFDSKGALSVRILTKRTKVHYNARVAKQKMYDHEFLIPCVVGREEVFFSPCSLGLEK